MVKPTTNLFVDEVESEESSTDVGMYEDAQMRDVEESSDEEIEPPIDDPIVESIPVFMNSIPDRINKSLHLIQYQGKPAKSPMKVPHLGASIKPESNFIEVSLPIDTSRFYDEERTEEWGQVDHHKHVGVFNKTNGGLFAAKFVVVDNQKKVVLVPIDSTAQLRASFKYMDDAENQKLQQRKDFVEPATRQNQQNQHVLQYTAKNTKTTNDPLSSGALGESLRHVRRFDQEEWVKVKWNETDDESSKEFLGNITGTNDVKLSTKMSMDKYLTQLTK